MAFTTTQNIDSLLTRGLNFRLPNNAPISSLYTLYANGQGQTYWSNSINPTNLSTLSTTIGNVESSANSNFSSLNSTIQLQSTQIGFLFGADIGIIRNMSIMSNALIAYTNSSIEGISTVSSFYYFANDVLSTTVIGLSTLSTTIGRQNASTYSSLTSNYTASINALSTSSRNYTDSRVSSLAGVVSYYDSTIVFSTQINRALISSVSTLNRLIVSSFVASSNLTTSLINSTFGVIDSLASVTAAIGSNVVDLLELSTNLSNITSNWITEQINTQSGALQDEVNYQSTAISTLQYSSIVFIEQFSTISTTSVQNYSTLSSMIQVNTSTISEVQRQVSILTTTALISEIYDTFIALEGYTSSLINSTINTVGPYQSSLFQSVMVTNQSISQAFFDYYTSTLYNSTLSTVLLYTFEFTSSLMSSLYSTGTYTLVSTLNSTAVGIGNSTLASSIAGYISTPAGIQLSTFAGNASTALLTFSTAAISTLNSVSLQTYITTSTVETSTIVAYNNFVALLASQISSAGLSTLYTEQVINLTGSNYVGTIDLYGYTNFYINVFSLASNTNSNYRVTYNYNIASNLPYRSGLITLNVSTVGYAGQNHGFRFDFYTWGVPTSIWSNVYPAIINYDYEAQYQYNILNNSIYTNLLNIYPRLGVSALQTSATANVYSSTFNAILSTTYWNNTPIVFNWSNYNGFPTSGTFGGPPFNPLIAIDFYSSGTLLQEYSTYTFGTSSATVITPVLNSVKTNVTALIYVVGKPQTGLSYNFTTINKSFNTLTIHNVPRRQAFNLLAGNELVVRTTNGKYPLNETIPTVAFSGSNSYYFNDPAYSINNFTNGLLNVVGNSPARSFTARTSLPVPTGAFYQEDITSNSGIPKLYFNPNDPWLSTLSALYSAYPIVLNVTMQNVLQTRSLSFSGYVSTTGTTYFLAGTTPIMSTNIFTENLMNCQLLVNYNLPSTTNGFRGYNGESNFVGGETNDFAINSNWTPHYLNIIAYYNFQSNFNASIGSNNNLTPVNAAINSNFSKVGTRSAFFNGTNAYADFPVLFPNTNQMTIATWVYYLGGPGNQKIYDFGQDTNYCAYFTPNSGSGFAQCVVIFNGSYNTLTLPGIPTNTWTHLAVVYDKNGNQLSVYYNGVFQQSRILPYSISDVRGSNGTLGKSKFVADPLFNGYLDEVVIWNNALTANEVSTVFGYQSEPLGSSESLRYTLNLSTTDIVAEIGYYNVFSTNIISQQAMSSSKMYVGVTTGGDTYVSTITFTGAQIQNFYF